MVAECSAVILQFVRSQWPSISLAPGGLDGKAGADKDSATAAQAESTGQDAKSSKHASKAQPCPGGSCLVMCPALCLLIIYP